MATRHQQIRTELDTDPLGRGYSEQSAAQAAADLNTVYRPAEIELSGVEVALRDSGKWTTYRERADATDQNGVYLNQAMREFLDLFLGSLPAYQVLTRTSEGYIADLTDAMIAEGSIGSGAGEALKAFDNNRQSRGSEIGVGIVSEYDVEYARSL